MQIYFVGYKKIVKGETEVKKFVTDEVASDVDRLD